MLNVAKYSDYISDILHRGVNSFTVYCGWIHSIPRLYS